MSLSKRTSILVFIAILFLIFEIALRLQRACPAKETDRPLFKEQYEDIYKPFFKKLRLADGTVVYKTQRKQEQGVEESFPARKIRGTRRIFILGGSVAYSFSRQKDREYIKAFLEAWLPEEKFEIIGCGMAAYDSYRESLIQKEILNYEPDLIVLLSGNNEFFYPVRFNLWAYRLNQLLRRSCLYRNLQDNFVIWGKNHRIIPEIDKNVRLLNFENNLKRMTRRAKNRKIPMLLCTLPANFRDCPPTGMPRWGDKEFFQAWDALNKKEFEEARKKLTEFIVVHPQDPFGYYFLGKCYDGLGDYPRAREGYLKAVDLDTEPGDRCPSWRNAIIRRLCSKEGMILVDLEKLFIKLAPHELVGDELFLDHCHWWDEYQPLVYEEIVRHIIGYYSPNQKYPSASLEQQNQVFTSQQQAFLAAKKESLENKAFRKLLGQASGICFKMIIDSKEQKDSLPKTNPACEVDFMDERLIASVQRAYQWVPGLFEDKRDLKKRIFAEIAKNPWQPGDILAESDKAWVVILSHIAEAFRRLGEYPRAMEYFNEAISLSGPDFYFPYLGRALVYAQLGETDKAKIDFKEIAKNPCQNPLIEFYRDSLGISN